MTYKYLLLISGFLLSVVSHGAEISPYNDCQNSWKSHSASRNCELVDVSVSVDYPFTRLIPLTTPYAILPSPWWGLFNIQSRVRAGFLAENPDVSFRGNILFFEGLGDSFQNHYPLFSKLAKAGFRVIAFDYMGQGGSEGDMNDTRIWDIPKIGLQVFKLYARDQQIYPQPIIIGWSTGGLAAYVAAYEGLTKEVVLLAPGLVPNMIVGHQSLIPLQVDRITLSTLTTAKYPIGSYNPHIDPIKPQSPLDVPDFALSLQSAAKVARTWKLKSDVKGYVLLSGSHDTYVNSRKTAKFFDTTGAAPGFEVVTYEGTLHEIDNEANGIRDLAHQDILSFLERP